MLQSLRDGAKNLCWHGEFLPEKPFDDWRNYSKTPGVRYPTSVSGLLLERRGDRFTYIQPSDELNTSPKHLTSDILGDVSEIFLLKEQSVRPIHC
jgi:hypothetical protein